MIRVSRIESSLISISGIAFTPCHPQPESARIAPFYHVSTNAASFYHDPPTAEQSIRALAEFDADPNILILIAHDVAPLEVLPFFPQGAINGWQKAGWKDQLHWGFLNELPFEGKARRKQLVDGLYKGLSLCLVPCREHYAHFRQMEQRFEGWSCLGISIVSTVLHFTVHHQQVSFSHNHQHDVCVVVSSD